MSSIPPPNKLMAAALLLLGLFMPTFNLISDAQGLGVCYGRDGNDLPAASAVINLYKSRGISSIRLYSPAPDALNALRRSNIQVILDVPNDRLRTMAGDASAASDWVQRNVRAYWPDVRFKYIAVGNEVDPRNGATSQYAGFVVPAMQNIQNAIAAVGLQAQIKVSTASYTGLLTNTFPIRNSVFTDFGFMQPIVRFLIRNDSPLLVNEYPYFSHIGNQRDVPLNYALFTAPDGFVVDGNFRYQNLFDALVDSHYVALEKTGGQNVRIVVSESGWPSAGGVAASPQNAETYYRNLINHVKSGRGTPRRSNRAIETYLFAMFDENRKGGAESERHFGLFFPDQRPKYQLNFN